jgi:hypothetical protein
MFKSTAEEISQWADQCRRWARNARTKEQRRTLLQWEQLFSDAALEAEQEPEAIYSRNPRPPAQS